MREKILIFDIRWLLALVWSHLELKSEKYFIIQKPGAEETVNVVIYKQNYNFFDKYMKKHLNTTFETIK